MPKQSQTIFTLPQVEIRIMPRQSQGYPIEFTLDQGQQTFSGGYLSADLLPWLASASPLEDGQRLFNSLFGDVRLKKAWAEIRGQHPQRRIRLHIDPGASELHAIPWELLRDATPGYTPQTLSADSSLPFSRYLPSDHDPGEPISERPLKMLVAIADPADLAEKGFDPINAEQEECPIIEAALADIGKDELSVTYLAGPVTLDALATALAKGYHILHIIAHGKFENEQAVLILADEANQAVEISDAVFAQMVSGLPTSPRLVYLVSCQSATRSPADAWRGLAPQLIQAGVPAVLAMQEKIAFETAQSFTTAFYQTLLWAQGGWVDQAANEARSTLMAGADFKGAAIPVLFSRLVENRLFVPAQKVDPASLTSERRRQLALLERVRQQPWFTAESVSLAGRITTMQEDRDAVAHPFAELNLTVPDNRTFPAMYSLPKYIQESDESSLLILTPTKVDPIEPLQQIAHDTAGQAKNDGSRAVPVLCALNRWPKGRTLDSWLVEELRVLDSGLSEVFARALLEEGRVLVLLTDLERLATDQQRATVTAINQFRDAWGQIPLVMSCSAALYDALPGKLKLDNALRLIPPGNTPTLKLESLGETLDVEIRIKNEIKEYFPVELTVNNRQQFTGHQVSLGTLPALANPPTLTDGERLLAWLLGSGPLQMAWDQIRQQGGTRHVRLRIDPDEVTLYDLPWELLSDPAAPGQPLAAAANTTFARFYPTAGRGVTPVTDRPLKVLVALANPTDLDQYPGRARLRPEQEQELLEQVRFKIDKSELSLTFIGHERPLSLADLKKALQSDYHILHVIGCAALIEEWPHLFLADEQGQVDLEITADRLGEMLQSLSRRPQLVILGDGQNALQSSAPAWRKIAPVLLRAGIPAVITIQAALPRDPAYAFFRPLYEELVAGSGHTDIAINAARVNLQYPQGTMSPISNLLISFPPILYTRTPTPHLFDQPPPALSEVKDEDRRNQLILLRKVREYWVEGVYEQSLQEVAKIELGMETQLDAMERTLTHTHQTDQLIPPGQRMIDLFDQLGGALLILGAPGAGKTFALLELARDLISRAERTPNHPLPVVFNLSSWQDPKQNISKWMVEELSLKYFIPRKIGRRWVEDKKIMPLLDGLDEVKADLRADCARAINTFHRENLVGLAVCSRIEEYKRLESKLNLAGAVRLRPLTREQIDTYLHRAGPALAAVRETLQHDKPLQELAETPLMLNVMALAYEGKSVEEIQGFDTVKARRRSLFDEYIRKMFNPKARKFNRLYPDEQTVGWLRWLAQKMQQHNQSEFLIEGLQPSWLSLTHLRWVYFLGSRLLGGLVIGIIFHITGLGGIAFSDRVNLPVSLVFGLTGGTFVGFIDGLRLRQVSSKSRDQTVVRIWNVLLNGLIFSVGYSLYHWLISGLIFTLIFWFHSVDSVWDKGFEFADPVSGVVLGIVIFGPIFGRRGNRRLENDIQTVETLRWSFIRALRGKLFWLSNGLIIGSILGFVLALVTTPTSIAPFTYNDADGNTVVIPTSNSSTNEPGFSFILQVAGLGLLTGGVIGSIWSGFYQDLVKTKNIPNQGIWLSLKNAVVAGLIIGLTFIVAISLLHRDLEYIISQLGIIGLGILGFLWYGGLDVIQHYILRLLLWQKQYIPRDYGHFLDYAAERIFLRKVGGGYIFIHRLLQEYFAGLGAVESAETK